MRQKPNLVTSVYANSSATSTTSTSFTGITNFKPVGLITRGNPVRISYDLALLHSSSYMHFQWRMTGQYLPFEILDSRMDAAGATTRRGGYFILPNLDPDYHTFQLYWRVSAGTGYMYPNSWFTVEEL